MRKLLTFAALLVMLGLPVAPVFAAETIQTCLQDPPINPFREGACGALLYNADTLPLTAGICAPIVTLPCPPPLLCPVLKYLTAKCVAEGYDTANRALCTQGPRGTECCIENTESPQIAVGDGKCVNEIEDCKVGGKLNYSCCVCEIPIEGGNKATRKVADSRQTFSSCEELCHKENPNATVYRQAGAGSLPPPPAGSNAPTAAELHEKLATCFTPQDCASAEYAGSPDGFRPGFGCPSGQGRCIAPEPEIRLSFPIGNITTVKGFRNFVSVAFNYGVSIAAIAAAIMFVWGGFRYIFGAAFTSVKRGKEIMIDAAIGLALVLGAITILQTVNPDALNLTRIEVFMINKSQILSSKFCSDIKTEKPITFADAGPRPAYTALNQVPDTAYSFAGADTRCNYEYYGKGIGISRCAGRKCDNAGEACVSCRSGACPQGMDPKGYGCVKSTWAGTIAFLDDKFVDGPIELHAVCNDVLKVPDYNAFANAGFINNGIVDVKTAKVTGQKGEKGTQSYSFEITKEDIASAKDKCASKGGIAGFVMSVEYNDPSLVGGNDETAIVGKGNCGGAKFSAYVDGSVSAFDTDLAILCGMAVPAKPLANPSSYWTMSDLEKFVGATGDPKPNICDIQLSNANAPTDPGSKSTGFTFTIPGGDHKCGS